MKLAVFVAVLVFSVSLVAEDKPCLLVRPSGDPPGGLQGVLVGSAFARGKFEYIDSFHLPAPKMLYKKSEIEKLQRQGVHVVLVPRDAVRDQIKQARESCKE